MSLDFWAGYISGAAGILIGNPLDLVKVRLQAGAPAVGGSAVRNHFESAGALIRGAPAPILGYGALNALLFDSYHRALSILGDDVSNPSSPWRIWFAGVVGGLVTWLVSAPTEFVKCRAQLSPGAQSSWSVTKDTFRHAGLRGLYFGGAITSWRDSIGYGFYFWSYELSKQWMTSDNTTETQRAVNILLCGGLAGVVTWASIFPLDVIKTRVQTQALLSPESILEQRPLLNNTGRAAETAGHPPRKLLGATTIARQIYREEGLTAFFRGLGVCSARAFVVNAAQWAVYEWMMKTMKIP